jgi:hypothetical protein
MTSHRGGEGQRVGCRTCDVVFRDRASGDLALIPCPVCGLEGEVISLPMPDTWPSDYVDEEGAPHSPEFSGGEVQAHPDSLPK